MLARIFVYGTLMRGEWAQELLSESIFVGDAFTSEASFEMRDFGPFPAVFTEGTEKIRGEVYDVSYDTLENLERYEGSMYERKNVSTGLGDCFMFAMDGNNPLRQRTAPIAGGDWKMRG